MDPREMLANPTMEQTSNSNTQTLINGQGQQAGLKMQPEGVKTAQDVTEEDVDKMQRSLFLAVLINKTHQCQELFYRLQNKAHGRGQITEKDSRETHRITKNLRDLICLAQTMNVCPIDQEFYNQIRVALSWHNQVRFVSTVAASACFGASFVRVPLSK